MVLQIGRAASGSPSTKWSISSARSPTIRPLISGQRCVSPPVVAASSDEVEPLVGDIELRPPTCVPTISKRRAEAVHQPVGPGPAIVEAADGAVLEIHHRVKRVLVAGAEHLALLRVDPGDAGPARSTAWRRRRARPCRRGSSLPAPSRRAVERMPLRFARMWIGSPSRAGSAASMHLHVARVEAQDVADHQPDAVALDRLDDAPRRGGVVRERLLQQDRLAGLGGGDCGLLMQPVRQADAHRLRALAARAAPESSRYPVAPVSAGELRDAGADRCRQTATSSAAG